MGEYLETNLQKTLSNGNVTIFFFLTILYLTSLNNISFGRSNKFDQKLEKEKTDNNYWGQDCPQYKETELLGLFQCLACQRHI